MIPIRDRLPTRVVPFVNYALVGLNVLVFLWQASISTATDAALIESWGFVPARFLQDPSSELITVFSSMFLHGGLLHVAGNMLFLWVFGDNVEDALGHARFLVFYLMGGLLAAIGQLLVEPSSVVPMVGASGAIAAVLAAYVSLYPRARVLVLVPVFILFMFFEFPAWLVVLGWFALQVLRGFGALAGGVPTDVAWFAHIGGFLAGLLLVRIGMIGRLRLEYDPWHGWRPPSQQQPLRFRSAYRRNPSDRWMH